MAKSVRYVPIDERDPATVRAVILARISDPGGKDATIESQVGECERFIQRMGWQRIDILREKASGYYQVDRPVLKEVERLIRQRQVDVVVCTEESRVSRDKMARYAAYHLARQYGVEYRFATIAPDGKRPDTMESRITEAVYSEFAEAERQKIVERTQRGKLARAAKGIPGAGRGGPPYGYCWANQERTAFAIREDEAALVREMFRRIDEDEMTGARTLAGEFNAQGRLTREGKRWVGQTILEKLRNPLYCGQGRLLRWQVTWEQQTNLDTGETYDARKVVERDAEQTLPLAAGAVPAIVSVELFERVQTKLEARRYTYGRLARESSPHAWDDTLLHGGLIRCAHCGLAMVRYWRYMAKGRTIPYYRCGTRARDVSHPCAIHAIPAVEVDHLALVYLSCVLSDPEQVLALADAAARQEAQVQENSERAAGRVAAYRERLEELAADSARYQRILGRLDTDKDKEEIDLFRRKLGQVEEERVAVEQLIAGLKPQRARAVERAALLQALQRARPVQYVNGAFVTEGEWRTMSETLAAQLLGRPIRYDEDDDGNTDETLQELLEEAPRELVRKLLRDLQVVVKVSRPKGKAFGKTPLEERVTMEILGEQAKLQVSAQNRNVTKLAMPTSSTPAAHTSG